MSKNKLQGFTILELMIVIIIIAILAAVSVGEYQQIIRKSRRSDAQTSLLDYHVRLQQCYLQSYDYSACIEKLGLNRAQNSISQYYLILAIETSKKHYLLQANAQGEQQNDKPCYQFSIDSKQVTKAYTKDGQENSNCWLQ